MLPLFVRFFSVHKFDLIHILFIFLYLKNATSEVFLCASRKQSLYTLLHERNYP